jgi:hypothetical protein
MMDPADKPPPSLARRTFLPVLGGIAAIAAIFGLLWVIADHSDVANSVFEFHASAQARLIAENGPAPFPDPLQKGRDIIVNHVGDDVSRGWYAFRRVPPNGAPGCLVYWDGSRQLFVDPCTATTYPPDGSGLTQLPVDVHQDRVAIDPTPETVPTTAAPTTAAPTTAAPTTAAPTTAAPTAGP